MSAYVGKLFTAMSSVLEFNTATLSGAIDIIVVEDDGGRRHCTPFHVRFGKLQLLKSRGIPVSVYLNGNRTDLTMLLGAAGEAYFYNPDRNPALDNHLTHPILPDTNIAHSHPDPHEHHHHSPHEPSSPVQFQIAHVPQIDPPPAPTPPLASTIPSSPPPSTAPHLPHPHPQTPTNTNTTTTATTNSITNNNHPATHTHHHYNHYVHPTVSETVDTDYPFSYISDSEVELTRTQRAGDAEVVDEPRSPPLFPPTRDWAAGPHHPSPLTAHTFHPSVRIAPNSSSNASLPTSTPTASVSASASAQPAQPESEDAAATGSADELSSSALFGLPASPSAVAAASRRSTSDPSDGEHDRPRHATPPSPAAASPSSSYPNGPLVDDDEAADGDDEREHRSEPHDVTVTDTLSDVVGEEDAKLDCRSMDGFDPPDTDDMLIGLQHRVTSVLSSRARLLPHEAVEHEKAVGETATAASSAAAGLGDAGETAVAATLTATVAAAISADAPTAIHSAVATDPAANAPIADGVETGEEVVVLSMCGELLTADMAEAQILELFERHRVSFEEFSTNPALLFDPALRVRFENRIVGMRVAAPLVFAAIAYARPMDIDELARLTAAVEGEGFGDARREPEPPKSPPTPRRFRWLPWSSPTVEGEPLLGEDDIDELDKRDDEAQKKRDEAAQNGDAAERKEENTADREVAEEESDEDHKDGTNAGGDEEAIESSITPESEPKAEAGNDDVAHSEKPRSEVEPEEMNLSSPSVSQPTISFSDLDPESLTLKPTVEELNSLDLKPGANTVRFVVESSAVELNCRIFLWSCHHKVVISDVDGTITRSDVLGHLLPAVGRDWSHVGVAGLYSQIEKNGYKLMYLTARPIGQASQTRAFLHSVTQGNAKLPNGPVLMSPNRLVESFTREVIRRKPHEFKIAALRELRSLFSPAVNPFYAGFGNRDTDVISYRAVGLMPQRIFVVNPRGELVVMKARYESAASYSTLQDLVENVFPDISGILWLAKTLAMTESATYNDWNYWKGTLPEVDFDVLMKR